MANRTHLVVMPGDGIGPEIMAATLHVLREVDRIVSLGLTFEEVPIGFPALKAHGSTLPDASFEAGKRADGVILGPVSHNDYPPVAQGGLNPSGEMRKRLDLYANIRPAKSRPGMPPRCGKPVDLVVQHIEQPLDVATGQRLVRPAHEFRVFIAHRGNPLTPKLTSHARIA